MATVTEPIMTDATGQSIDSKLNSLLGKMDNLAAAFQPNASGIVYSNATSGLTGDDVQEAIDEMAADVSEIKQSLSDIGTFYTYSWTANSSSAYGAQLTQKITLPKGNYILFGVSPVLSVTECAIALTSNNTINAPFTLNNVRTRTLLGYTFQVTQDNTDVWIMAGGSLSVTYTNISDASGRIIRVG